MSHVITRSKGGLRISSAERQRQYKGRKMQRLDELPPQVVLLPEIEVPLQMPLPPNRPLTPDAGNSENRDAHDYHNRLRDTCMFFTCAVCALEDGLKEMQELTIVIKSAVSQCDHATMLGFI